MTDRERRSGDDRRRTPRHEPEQKALYRVWNALSGFDAAARTRILAQLTYWNDQSQKGLDDLERPFEEDG